MAKKATIRTLIVEDDSMTRTIMGNYINQTESLELVGSCNDGLEASNFLNENAVDLLILDVEMPGLSGIELVRSLNEVPNIIIVSSKKEYAADAFDLEVVDFIAKPVEYPRLLKAIGKVKARMEGVEELKTEHQSLFVKVDGQFVNVQFDDIQLIESRSDYITIHTENKRYTVYATMKGVIQKLPQGKFLRVHRSYIIPISKIVTFEDNTLSVEGKLIPVGVTYREKLLQRLNLL